MTPCEEKTQPATANPEGGREPQATNAGSLRNPEKAREWILPFRLQKEYGLEDHLDFRPLRCISDFWPVEPWDNKFVLFGTSRSVIICYSSNRKLMQTL